MAMRPARRSFRRPLLIGVAMLGLLWFLFGRGGSAATYDPAQAALAYPEHTTNDPDDPTFTSRVHASIVVPCYHEKDNLRPLVTRVFAAVTDKSRVEIVLVDDNSRDGTVEEVEKLRAEGHNVRVIVRTAPGEKGLSSAVLRGFQEARGTNLVCMDADLQHPPEAVQKLIDALDDPTTPIALGTRYAPGVEMDKNWPWYRHVISWGARSLARPLTSASDPMTGFFGIRKELFLKSSPINPSGFKIALELLLKAPIPKGGIAEVPFSFGTRSVGESKLSSKVMLRYVGQLYSLYWYSWGLFFPLTIIVLGAVGSTLALFALQQADQRLHLGLGPALARVGLGGLLNGGQQRKKLKSEV